MYCLTNLLAKVQARMHNASLKEQALEQASGSKAPVRARGRAADPGGAALLLAPGPARTSTTTSR